MQNQAGPRSNRPILLSNEDHLLGEGFLSPQSRGLWVLGSPTHAERENHPCSWCQKSWGVNGTGKDAMKEGIDS